MFRTLVHYWRIHLAVACGAAVAATVLAGALLVGDSVRGSLRDLTLDRLGAIDHALVSSRFFPEDLARRLETRPGFSESFGEPAPIIVLNGSATNPDTSNRASRVGIHGVDERFSRMFDAELNLDRRPGQIFPSVVINESLQRELSVQPGQALLLSFGRWSRIPRETLMGEKAPEDVLGSVRLTVTDVIPDRGLGRFGITPRQQVPLNAFLSLGQLQRSVELSGQVNALLVAERDGVGESPNEPLRAALALEDLGLSIRRAPDHLSVESVEFVLRAEIEEAIVEAAGGLGAPVVRTQSYLANEMVVGERAVPYSMVTALDLRPELTWASLALGNGSPASPVSDAGILLNRWTADQLEAARGDELELAYYVVGPAEELRVERAKFRVEGVVELQGLGADRRLTPNYPGIQDAEDIAAWDPPFPVELDRIRTEDELYWDEYGATPKAFVSVATGRRLWTTRFGSTTAIRIGAPEGVSLDRVETALRAELSKRLSPESFGLSFRAVKADGLRAARGATDFASLFLSFSFFLIVSAALLVGLLFRLGVEQRAGEVGLLLAVGYPVSRVRRSLLMEGALLAATGAAAGLVGALAFAGLMMVGLRTIWRPAVGSSELFLHVTPLSLGIGWAVTLFVVLLSVWFSVRRLVRVPPTRLLAGSLPSGTPKGSRRRWSSLAAWGGLAGGLGLTGAALVSGTTESPGLAFGTGSLLLISGLAFFARWCRGSRRRRVARAVTGMAARNTSWNPGRSILSVALVGAACFMVLVVEVFRLDPKQDLEDRDSGSGGFSLIARSDVPLLQDLTNAEARFDLGFTEEVSATLEQAAIFPARLLAGDDASCLNLYRPERPTVLGLPHAFIERGGFRFKQTLDLPEGADPWSLLEQPLDDGAIPAITDIASAMWILHLKLGDEIVLDDEQGRPTRLRLVALLDRSIFRSELLISEENFLEHFPAIAGDGYFLIDAPPGTTQTIATSLESTLESFGFDAVTTRERIAGYEAVQNTYLSTFQVLGGLGLLLGTVGLGVVLVRNIIERRGELATLRAFGFRRSRLAWLILAENAFLLVTGIVIGSAAALASVAPSLVGRNLPWPSLIATLLLVLLVGMLSSIAAVIGTLRVPLLPALKSEH